MNPLIVVRCFYFKYANMLSRCEHSLQVTRTGLRFRVLQPSREGLLTASPSLAPQVLCESQGDTMMASAVTPSRGLGGAFQPAKAQQPFAPRRSVVALVKPSRAADFRGLNNEEILGKIAELKERQFQLKYLFRSRGVVLNHTTPEAQPDAEKVPKVCGMYWPPAAGVG